MLSLSQPLEKDMMKPLISKLAGVALAAAVPLTPVTAQPAATIAVGMPVVDIAEAPVGTISSRNGDNVMLKTDRHEIPLPATSFTVKAGKAYFGMTRAQVNAEYEKAVVAAKAAAEASLTPGSVIKGLNGNRLGTIESIDAVKVLLKLDSGQTVELPRSGVAGRADGAVAGITAEDLARKVAGN